LSVFSPFKLATGEALGRGVTRGATGLAFKRFESILARALPELPYVYVVYAAAERPSPELRKRFLQDSKREAGYEYGNISRRNKDRS
jgi:hypothetical protein